MTFIPTHQCSSVADQGKVIACEIRDALVFSITASISWRGIPSFEVSVSDTVNKLTETAVCDRYGQAKRLHKKNLRTWQ